MKYRYMIIGRLSFIKALWESSYSNILIKGKF